MLSRASVVSLAAALLLGVLFTIAGVLALTVLPKYIDNQLIKEDVLGEEDVNGTLVPNPTTAKWLVPPYDMRLHIWMYSVENEMEYLEGGKARLSQKGPYVFVERQNKTFHKFVENGTHVLYRNTRSYFFSQNLSCGDCSLGDSVTIPNVVFQKLIDIAEKGPVYRFAIQSAITAIGRESPFSTITVGQALFEGFEEPLVNAVCNHWLIKPICKSLDIPDKIGFFTTQNQTNDGVYEVGTGAENSENLGLVYTWNGKKSLPETWWTSPYARMINGTDGQMFPPLLRKEEPLVVFASQACRSISMSYTGDVEFEGVPSWRFAVPPEANDPARPENRIFCHVNTTPAFFNDSKVQIPGCLPAALLDLSSCQPGNPRVYLSQAHFLYSPREVWASVSGLSEPSTANDETYVLIEPTSGVPVAAKRVMQINIGMKKSDLSIVASANPVIMPVLWLNETAVFDEGTRDQLLNHLLAAKHWATVGGISATILGSLLVIAVLIFLSLERASQSRGDFHRLEGDGQPESGPQDGFDNPNVIVDESTATE